MDTMIDDEQDQIDRELAASMAVAEGIERAKIRYGERVAEIGDRGPAGFVWVTLPLDEANRPVIDVLQSRKRGGINTDRKPMTYRVWDREIVKTTVQNMIPAEDACRHFVDCLMHAGFTARVDSAID